MSYLTPIDAANASICYDPLDADHDDVPRRIDDRDDDRDDRRRDVDDRYRRDADDARTGAPWANGLERLEELRERFGGFEGLRDQDDRRCRDVDRDRDDLPREAPQRIGLPRL